MVKDAKGNTLPFKHSDPRMDKVPINSHMATIINGPTGIVESKAMTSTAPALSSGAYHKRKQLFEKLVVKFSEEHGRDEKTMAVIINEVARAERALLTSTMTPTLLATLEVKVASAVRDSRPQGPRPSLKPPPTYAPPMPVGELRDKVKAASNWTDVAMHRNAFYNIEMQRKVAAKEQEKQTLRTHVYHQMSLEQHKTAAEKALMEEEARQVAADLALYERDMAQEKAKKLAKVEVEKAARAAQMREQAARAAAAQRLQKLEDEEMDAFLRKELEADAKRKEVKQRANEEYHKATMLANVAAKARREEEKQSLWAEEAKLNAQWKAMLDKQEDDRNAQYAGLRERIHKMQRVYQNSAGADLERRIKEEEEANARYVEAHERMLDEQFAAKKKKREDDIQANLAFLKMQQSIKQHAKVEDQKRDREYAAEVLKDVALAHSQEEQKIALRKARLSQQTAHLHQQITEQKEQKARDPGSSEMTEIEAAINRPLLVSIVQHKYHSTYANPLTG